jgi:phosphatidyl-myo-inositol alpha-mannosyltransferase
VKIAHVFPYDHSVSGGVRTHVVNLDVQHRAMGFDVKIVAAASDPESLASNVICVGTRIVSLRAAGSVARLSMSPLVFRRIARVFERERFDVVHIHEPLAPMVSFAAVRRVNGVAVGTIHGYRPGFSLYRYLNAPLGRMMNRLSARTAVSTDARDWASRYFPGDYHIISDGVDTERFGDPGLKPIGGLDDGRPNVLFVGRLEPRKGFAHLLDAFPMVQREIPEARLVAVGDYSEREAADWREKAIERGVRDVEFVGRVTDEELPRYYRSATVFCAPSTGFEALGIVLLEAMACGVPVVTTNIEGYRTVVRDESEGVIVPPKDPEALGRGLLALLTDPGRRERLGERGRARAQDYAWPGIAARLAELYESCLRAVRR